MTIPQVVGMYKNDRTRKEILVDFGFRLPSALDNRPLTFEEFEVHVNQAIYVSATPGPYELEKSEQVVEQLIRPTGIVDPQITVRPTEGQIDDLLEEIRGRVDRGERALVTTLTKKMAEDLADYLQELGVKVQYLHSEVDTLERVAILRDLRLGVYDVLVGINLLREGLDLPEVTLVAILDADKEGFLRSAWSLIQMIGRAARNIGGEVVMYADRITESMKVAIEETDRRRAIQERLQRRARHRAADDHQGHPRHQRPPARRRREHGRVLVRAPGAQPRGGRQGRGRAAGRADGGRDEAPPRSSSSSSARRRCATRSSRSGCASSSEDASVGRGPCGGARGPATRRCRPRSARRPTGRARAAPARASRRSRSPRSRCCRRARSRPAARTPTRARSGVAAELFPGIRDEHDDDDGGWQARWLDRPTWDVTVTPNIRRRTGQRPTRRTRGY